jgi:TonB-linked SusC/RagA family outer membrane protein
MRKILLTLCAFIFVVNAWAQERIISGKVTQAEDGASLPGVNVLLKNSNKGTVTDAEGNYQMSVPTSGGTLVFSFIGMVNVEVEVGDRTIIDVQLTFDIKNLAEVVVTAQGVQQEKKALGYAISTVSGKKLEQKAETDISRMLSGKLPGINITSTGGASGSGTNINIRGYNSITGNTQPLFIVDGTVFDGSTNSDGLATPSRFLDIDPNNIETISVLKGLAASVLYGEQGRNGVILITTKNASKKRNSKMEINLNQSYFLNKIASLPEYQDNFGNGGQQFYGPFYNNWGPRFGTGLDSIPHPFSQFNDLSLRAAFPEFQGKKVAYKAYDNTRFWRTGAISNTSININGSSDKINYNTTIGRIHDEGFTPGNSLEKLNLGTGINVQLTDRFSIDNSLNFVITDMETPPISGSDISVYANVLYTPRSIDLMGLPFESPVDHRSVYYRTGNDIQNPRWTAKYAKQTSSTRRFFARTSFNFDILDNLRFTYRVGLDSYNERQEFSVNKGGRFSTSNGKYRTLNMISSIWTHDIILNYTKAINEKINLSTTIGMNGRFDRFSQDGIESNNQIVFGFINHDNFQTHNTNGLQYRTEKNYYGAYASVTADYSDYLFLNLQARKDWISTLEKANNSIFYPSASLSFIPTTAFGLESNKINQIKLRAGYGTSAGFPGTYNTRSVLSTIGSAFKDNNGLNVTTNSIDNFLGNPNLKPELQEEIEIGIEGKFLTNRLNFELTLYDRNTKDLITSTPLDLSTGYDRTLINIGKLSNKGIELSLTGTPILTANFQWDITVNYYAYRPVVVDLGPSVKEIYVAGVFSGIGNYAVVGQPFNVIKGNYVERDSQGRRIVSSNGYYKPSNDTKIIGNPNPDFTSSVINTITYKGFTFNAQFDYRQGGDIRSETAATVLSRGSTKDTDFIREATYVLPGVKESDGSPNDVQITANDYFFQNVTYGPNENQIYDGTTVRLREVSLAYTLPKKLLQKTPFKAVQISLLGQNLWFRAVNFPKYLNFDTDVLSTGVGNGLGFDYMTGPSGRKYGVSMKITF